MGGRGSSSSSFSKMTVEDKALDIAKNTISKESYSGSFSIPNWFVEKNLTFNERQAWNVGDDIRIERETEKAYKVSRASDFGKVSMWVPKSVVKSGKKLYEESVSSQARKIVGIAYNRYLKDIAGLSGSNRRYTNETLEKKLSKSKKSFMTKEEFRKSRSSAKYL